ncbi:MAG: 30S ribosomal protein S13 [Pseudomonadota bacterium]|uniref:30S ribosomal subunit protein S13 n=1 Tax=anaerobic digester metagenome TaxID=1263854 RepID=A0A485LWD4_9ZZZZ|nr:30S ribosomal protein S13 [Pseudomonadota bacterium]HON39583.1 30S ribosomal protein S13 [Deltaproteobacteria bacterium]HRS57263.1 30S ribosomal protein S13 [Desulfomonilia bacterium]HPD22296.1 30S ribosomal protein S13 [Deltaproteobacteria bacterium]HPX19307.1 30S ribosomal protein S13 [Deltaproteobacteria bacterium]
MARIAGVDLPRNKRIDVALTYIYGIGNTRAKEILTSLDIDPSKKSDDLTEQEIAGIRDYIDKNLTVEGDLRREVTMNIRRLMDIASYRGLRHRKGLPVRGQNTHNNARTRKGPRRLVVGRKK